ncbi:MAG: hypothetical protein A2189_07490 [Paenibacillus sp. RIFOXYA1_FULL_44_5]|nr:MAG: hypothetical protein A2189_07490 [Paenibacillus sp. RIFOXYA1_FULL_44_5]
MFTRSGETELLQLLIQAAENTLKAAHLFRQAVTGTKKPASYVVEMKALEDKGDDITHHIYTNLNQVQIERRVELMGLAGKLDDVLDGFEATIARFDYLNVDFITPYMNEFSAVLVQSCEHILRSFELYARKNYLHIREHTVQINSLENEGDRLMREGIREIFRNPKDPYYDFKLKEIYERLEQTTDACEDVADILDNVILKMI